MKLLDLIREYYSVSIIGMCKNAGKTTVLNRMISEMSGEEMNFAITSIGRDGEGKDVVTGTHKPGIYVPVGTLVATAFEMLKYCDVTKEILDATGISTPMGEVIIFRCLSDGSVQIAGPSLVEQLAVVREKFRSFGAGKVIIDGALSRKSLCAHSLSDATVLCTGASYNKDMDIVAEDTGYICKLLTLPVIDDSQLKQAVASFDSRACIAFTEDKKPELCDVKKLDAVLKAEKKVRYLYFGGAVSDVSLKPLLMSGASVKDVVFLASDSSKLLLSRHIFDKIYAKGGSFAVLNGVNPVAVTINPFSAYGFHFDKDKFIAAVRAEVDMLPVFNAEEM